MSLRWKLFDDPWRHFQYGNEAAPAALRGRENAFDRRLEIVDGVKRLGIKTFDDGHDVRQLFPLDDGEDDLDRTRGALSFQGGDAKACSFQAFNQVGAILSGRDVDNRIAQSQLLFDEDAQEIAQGKPAGEGNGTAQIRQILHHLSDGKQPDADLEEAQERGQTLPSPSDKDGSNRRECHDARLGEENEEGQGRNHWRNSL